MNKIVTSILATLTMNANLIVANVGIEIADCDTRRG